MSMSKKQKRKTVTLFIVFLFLLIIYLFPLYWMIKTSVIKESAIYRNPPSLGISSGDFDARRYFTLLKETNLFKWIVNTVFLAVVTSLITLIVALPAAYSLSRYKLKSNKLIGYVLLITRMMPLTLLIVPMYLLFSKIKLMDTYLAVILADLAYILPFSIWTLKSFISSIPPSIDEAAKIDGSSVLTTITKIILPLALPGIGSSLVYSFVRVWGEYLFSNSFLKSPGKIPVTVGAQLYAGSIHVSWGNTMAVTTIGSIPMLFVFFYLEKYYVGGLSAGAVKS